MRGGKFNSGPPGTKPVGILDAVSIRPQDLTPQATSRNRSISRLEPTVSSTGAGGVKSCGLFQRSLPKGRVTTRHTPTLKGWGAPIPVFSPVWGRFADNCIDVRQARIYIDPPVRDVAQSGRVLEWGSRGRGFESRRPDHPSPLSLCFLCVLSWHLIAAKEGQRGASRFVVVRTAVTGVTCSVCGGIPRSAP